jgi:hypothetical protein
MSAGFKAGSTPWFASLVGALSRSPQEIAAGKTPSILILDDFDVCGPDDINIKNMKHFCHDLHRLQDVDMDRLEMYIIILTQSREVGDKLCRINNWKKIGPMPGCYVERPPEKQKRDADVLPNPEWTLMPWSREGILVLVRKRFTEAELKDIQLDFIQHGANPLRVIKFIKTMIKRKRSDAKGIVGPDFV